MSYRTYRVTGLVIDRDTRQRLSEVRVEAWDKDLIFDDRLAEATTDGLGRFLLEFRQTRFQDCLFDREPDLYFKIYRGDTFIWTTANSVVWNVGSTLADLVIEVPLGAQAASGDLSAYRVEGLVYSPDSVSVGGLAVAILDLNIGQSDLNIEPLATATTDPRGEYRADFDWPAEGKLLPDLQARVYANDVLLAASAVRYNATSPVRLDVALPADVAHLQSEYASLIAALAAVYPGNLRDLREDSAHHDLAMLANKTGWDARAVAFAALADRFGQYRASAPGATVVPPRFYYALFRAGLPADRYRLWYTDPASVKAVWEQAQADRVIPKSTEEEMIAALESFRQLVAETLLSGSPLVGVSSLDELLVVSGLNETQRKAFAKIYATHRTDAAAFQAALEQQFPQEKARLELDSRLALVTINNASLMQPLHDAIPNLSNLAQLAQLGYHQAGSWAPLVAGLGDRLPREIPGATLQEKQRNYADHLAAEVRLSYPTAALADLVAKSTNWVAQPSAVSNFLSLHQQPPSPADRFEIGVEPVRAFLARRGIADPGETIRGGVEKLQRVRQITPDDQALGGLLKNNLDSAYAVVGHDRATFIRNYATDLGGEARASLIHDRAVQVHNATLNVLIGYLSARNALPLGGDAASVSGATVLQPAPNLQGAATAAALGTTGPTGPADSGSTIATATLEALFAHVGEGMKGGVGVIRVRRKCLLTCLILCAAIPGERSFSTLS
jgi:hypothetical protein